MKEFVLQTCNRCVMDNSSDSTIYFDENGFCNYCTNALKVKKTAYFPNEEGKRKLDALIGRLKSEGKGKKYDCIMGISGGLDSSYLAYLGSKWGLRILAVHVDDGFDTEICKRNIEKLMKATNIDYVVEKPDAVQFNALIKAYFMAGVPNLAVPQDNILFACVYRLIRNYKIRTFLSGGNFALECILQQGNTYRSFDVTNIKAIHKASGTEPIDKLPLLSDYRRFIDQKLLKIETLRPLNLIDYNRERALNELADFCGFEYYGSKHLENTLTKFIQVYWFYKKFGVDKRRSHLSSITSVPRLIE
jgi:asparagine synthetase B (glutamine-hydrolysing)